jgi:hypothetical protein
MTERSKYIDGRRRRQPTLILWVDPGLSGAVAIIINGGEV